MTERDFHRKAMHFAARCPATERAIIAYQIDRLMKGFDLYGPLSERIRKLDLTREKAEEAADLLMYAAMDAHIRRENRKPAATHVGRLRRFLTWCGFPAAA